MKSLFAEFMTDKSGSTTIAAPDAPSANYTLLACALAIEVQHGHINLLLDMQQSGLDGFPHFAA